VALLVAMLTMALTASGARAGDGTISASCNYNWQEMTQFGPHVQIDSANLWPTGNLAGQWVAAKEYLYQYGTTKVIEGPWHVYWADRVGKVFTVGGPDFHQGPGWWAARIVAYAWNAGAGGWDGPTTNSWVRYDDGSWWCHG
jgi:hypothetical protein